MNEALYVAGVDVGGTNLRVAVASAAAPDVILAHRTGPMPSDPAPTSAIGQIGSFLAACCAEVGIETGALAALASTVPGITDARSGETLLVTNLPGWDHFPYAARLTEAFGLPACIDNDTNAAALAEYLYGPGEGRRSLAYLTVSTGIAAGFVVDGRLIRGYRHAAGELGFIVPDPAHLNADWSPNGCLEHTAAGVGLAQYWAAYTGDPEVTAIDVFEAAREGHEHARWLVNRAADYLAQTVIAVASVLNPEVVVLGGSIALNEPLIGERIRACVAHFPYAPDVVDASLAGNAPLIGALAMAARSGAAGA